MRKSTCSGPKNSALLALGSNHSCALVGDGAKCWGLNLSGQLGDNRATGSLSARPVHVRQSAASTDPLLGFSEISAVAGGFGCANVNGSAMCWGTNNYGQLGNPAVVNYGSIPTLVQGLSSGVQSVAAGRLHACALVNDVVKCWGSNSHGQLGGTSTNTCGSTACSRTPIQVNNLPSGVQALAAGYDHTCAIANGGVWCWGNNFTGQLGDHKQSGTKSAIPVQVEGMTSGATAIAAGQNFTCAIVKGSAKCWGANSYGQLGNNKAPNARGEATTNVSSIPVQVSGMSGGAESISVGGMHACAISSGTAQCWGRSECGQLGDGGSVANCGTSSISFKTVPNPVVGLTHLPLSIKASSTHTCSYMQDRSVSCWGVNKYGELGDGTFGDAAKRSTAAQVLNIP